LAYEAGRVDENEENKPSLVSGINKRNVNFKAEAEQFDEMIAKLKEKHPNGFVL
jgi:hypothetical protein